LGKKTKTGKTNLKQKREKPTLQNPDKQVENWKNQKKKKGRPLRT